MSALVTLDAAKAYDSVEHGILHNKLARINLPTYIFSGISEFLAHREFFCRNGRLFSGRFPQTRGVPQGSVLSPSLFNILMSDIPIFPDVTTYVYADDIAFFCGRSRHSFAI